MYHKAEVGEDVWQEFEKFFSILMPNLNIFWISEIDSLPALGQQISTVSPEQTAGLFVDERE